ncbi:type II toxin-antitoxin system VapC family toxin [Pseudomonadota bacterium]|jgi:predicted nucleic acid-binding protein|nr:type II toxin-antitoxin system VapC family toxin [Xanthomonadales bacterium]
MILVDTSIWVEHLRAGSAELAGLLLGTQVLMHPFVVGELACGNLKSRQEVLSLLDRLPGSKVASEFEVRYFIEENRLMGRGIGYIDAHLLASTVLTAGSKLWTADLRLAAVAAEIGLSYP